MERPFYKDARTHLKSVNFHGKNILHPVFSHNRARQVVKLFHDKLDIFFCNGLATTDDGGSEKNEPPQNSWNSPKETREGK